MGKGLLAGIYNCSNEGEKKHSGMKKLMRQLGEDGFAPIADPTDVRARWLSEQGLAGLITNERLVAVGLPPDVWTSEYPDRDQTSNELSTSTAGSCSGPSIHVGRYNSGVVSCDV